MPTQQHRRNRTSPLRLVDRDAALETLIREPLGASSSFFLISGESGTGKSTLIRAALDHYRRSSRAEAPVNLIACHPSPVPYSAWAELIEQQPTIADAIPAPLGRAEPAAQGRDELLYAAARALSRLASEKPLTLLFDDIQHADLSSLDLLLALARESEGTALRLVLACETPLPEGSPVASFVPALFRETRAESIELGPLSLDGIRTLLRERLGPERVPSESDLASRIRQLSGGNPLYVAEMIDALADGTDHDAIDMDRQFSALPFSLRQLAEHRLSAVSGSAREILELAAIVGDDIDVELLAEIAGHDIEQVIDQLEHSLAAGILVEDEEGRLRFRHGIVRQLLAERQSGIRRQRWHRAIVATLQRRPGTPPIAIARHAEAARDFQTAIDAYRQAGHQARDLFNMPDAARSYRMALEIAEQAGLDEALRDELRLQYADSIIRNAPAMAAREYERVAARSYVRGDRLTLARARQRQATLFYEIGRREDALTILGELIPELRELEDWQTLADALTCALYSVAAESNFLALDRLIDQLIDVADRINKPSYRATAYFMEALSRVARGDAAGAPLAIRQAIAMAMELGKLDIATPWTAVAFFRVDIFANLHRPDQVEALIERGLELDAESNRRIGLSPEACDCTPEFAYWWLFRGEWERARGALPDPVEIRSAPQPQVLKDSVHVIAAELAMAAGDAQTADLYLDYIAPSASMEPGDHSYQQWLMAAEQRVRFCLERGDLDEAERWVEALDRELERKPHVPGELMLDISRTRIYLAREQASHAREVATSVVSRARQTHNMLALIGGLMLFSRAEQALGCAPAALEAAEEAVLVADNCRLDFLKTLARINRLEISAALGKPVDGFQAELEELLEQVELLGAAPAQKRLARIDRRRSRERPGGLTRRELEVLALIVEGKTDNEIAEILYISPRTVSTHVGNMLAKTGSTNRVELSTWAHLNGALN